MKRRRFLHQSATVLAAAGLPRLTHAASQADSFRPSEGAWRTFTVTTTATVKASNAPVRIWVPIPSFYEADWMRPGATTFQSNATSVHIVTDPQWNTKMVFAEWANVNGTATLKTTSILSSRDLAVDLSRPGSPVALSSSEYRLYTSPTKLLPTGGIVGQTANKIVGSTSDELEKAKSIYEWIVVNASRNPKTRGCGLGDVSFMLQTGDLSGKCADINGLFVALARAAGLPARDLYGIRVAPSRFGYKSLGTKSETITKAQHCRAEVYLQHYGWVPADPADVRKVMLEEPPGNLPLTDPKVADARRTLFGAWEGNYAAYNDGHDIVLPGSSGDALGFLMYPQAEVGGERKDSLAPDDFVYSITIADRGA
jgi:transglutaminase-like putative cysteine protease